jgi:UDP-glucose 4-epimerase
MTMKSLSSQTILVTGGAGYIGSHTCIELLNAGHEVVVFDNFCNSHPESIRRVEHLSGKKIVLIEGDIRNQSEIENVLRDHKCSAVMHFAGLKAVGESVERPLSYYDNNFIGTHRLLSAMQTVGVNTLVFSSSATVYGDPQHLPIDEKHPLAATNPYGRSKLFIEEMLRDHFHAHPEWSIAILRYFNPVGAHESGLIGEDPRGTPNNLMPFVAQVAVGLRNEISVWGNDYPTPDGTGVRDYIHVVDLAVGHLKALLELDHPQCMTINLGTGRGYSVLQVISAFEVACGKPLKYAFADRRLGDVASCYADTIRAADLLDWHALRDLQTMCTDHWRWQKNNPQGYGNHPYRAYLS